MLRAIVLKGFLQREDREHSRRLRKLFSTIVNHAIIPNVKVKLVINKTSGILKRPKFDGSLSSGRKSACMEMGDEISKEYNGILFEHRIGNVDD